MRAVSVLFLLVLATAFPAFAAPVNGIVAVVNGEMITQFDLQAEMAPEALRMGLDPRKPQHQEALNSLARKTLDQMIGGIILLQEANRLKMAVSEREVDDGMRDFLTRNKLTPEEFRHQLDMQKLSEKTFRKRLHDSLIRNRLLATMVGRKVVVTQDEIARYYDAHHSTFMRNQTVRFGVLVYPPTVDAEKYAASIRKGAASFESVARSVSIGPKAQEGGDVGSVNWGDMDPSWRERLSALKPGEVSPLFELNGMKAQLKLLALEAGEGQSLEEASEQIEAILREPKLQERFTEYTDQLRRRAVIDIRL